MKKRLLYISIALPPKNDPECIQAGRYLKYLNELGKWQITALTSSVPTLFMPYDPTLKDYLKDVDICEIKIIESKLINRVIRLIYPEQLLKPDSKMTFHWQWKKVVNSITPPDLIYSRSFPLSSSIMAFKLKNYFKVPWIMHLSDPWVESPLHEGDIRNNRYHNEMEKKCFEQASLISFTTQQALKLYSEKFPQLAGKFFISPNVYDPDQPDTTSSKGEINKTRIVYTGGLANTRDASVLLECLDEIDSEGVDINQSLEIIFAGELDRKNKVIFNDYKHLTCMKHIGVLSQQKSVELQKSADILLVLDSKIKDPEKNVFFPSKLLDYMVREKFILGITQKGSPTDNLISSDTGKTFSFDEFDQLKKWLTDLSRGNIRTEVKGAVKEDYSARYQAERLSQKMLTLFNGES